jgi:hypothetical protein
MRPLKFVGALALALIFGRLGHCRPDLRTRAQSQSLRQNDRRLWRLHRRLLQIRGSHAPRNLLRPIRVEIRGECDSACVMKLSAPDVCVSRNTIIGVHEVRQVYDSCAGYSGSKRDEPGTAEYRASMPACAQRLFDSRNAFASNKLTKFTGQEVLDACPQIKACK